MTPGDLTSRKAQLIAQSELDRMRIAHAMLGVRQSVSPAALLGGSPLRTLAGGAVGFALPLLARRSGILRVAAFAVAAYRTLRRFARR